MPEFELTSPDGKKYTVTAPEGATPRQAYDMLQKQLGQQAPGTIASGTVEAAPPSVGEYAAAAGQGALEFGKGAAQGAGFLAEHAPFPIGAGGKFVSNRLEQTVPGGQAVAGFINAPSQSWPQTIGREAIESIPFSPSLGTLAKGAKATGKVAVAVGGNQLAWETAHYLAHFVPGGEHMGWVLYHALRRAPTTIRKALGMGEKAAEESGEALKGAKGAGTFIPKAAETTGAKAAKTQRKFSTPLKKLPYAEEAEPLEGSYDEITPRGPKK